MSYRIELAPEDLSNRAMRYVLAKAQMWSVTPGEALARLLDLAARRELKRLEKRLQDTTTPAA